MKIAIMQPYFFPYIGYFQLINLVDKWIIFDTPQYIRHGWVNRNKIIHPNDGSQYIIVPLKKHSRNISIKDVQVNNDQNWKERILGQLMHYKKKAKYFNETYDLISECFDIDVNSLSKLNIFILERVCRFLDINFNYQFFSEMTINIESISHPGDWALFISNELKAREYINPPGGVDLFEPAKFAELGIKLNFIYPGEIIYQQGSKKNFISNLSIIDILMWNSKHEIKKMLNQFALKAK